MSKIKIRLNTFETNSSSAHTMVILDKADIAGDDEINEVVENKCKRNRECKNKDGTFYFPIDSGNCYGTGFEILEDWEDKLDYLVASLKSDYEEDIIKALQTRIPKCIGLCFQVYDKEEFLENHFEEYGNITAYNSQWNDGELYGTVDHQSTDMGENIVTYLIKQPEYKNKEISDVIADIIFSNKFIIITDSDGDSTFDTLMNMNFFEDSLKKGKIYREIYHYNKGNSFTSCEFVSLEDYGKEEED